ncbi:MAG: hypothetical protein ACO3JZ_07205 [Schleiferiaceae bacterium]
MKNNVAILFLLFALASCKHDPINPPDSPTSSSQTCHPDTVYFVNDILPLFQANCSSAGCHSSVNPADGLALVDYNSIMDEVKPGEPNKSDVYEVLVETGNDIMPPPPASPLDSISIWKVYTWISQGALENQCDDCDTSSGSFSQTILPIVQSQCQSCHSNSNASGNVSLMGYSDVINAVNYSNLVLAIRRLSTSPMPPSASLSECELAQFDKWIENGMPNN